MKILHVIPHYLPSPLFGGTPQVCHHICHGLASRGHQVTLLTTDVYDANHRIRSDNQFDSSQNYGIIRFFNLSNKLAFNLKLHISPAIYIYLIKHLRNFEIVHLHEFRTIPNLMVSLAAGSIPSSKRIILQPHGTFDNYNTHQNYKSLFDGLFSSQILKATSAYIGVSNEEVKLLNQVSSSVSSVFLLPNGVAKPAPEAPLLTPLPKKYILYLGRIDKRKGLIELITAFHRGNFYLENIHLVIAGSDDGYLKVLHRLITSLGIEKWVTFPGPVNAGQRTLLFRRALCLAYVTQKEVFGLVPLEAALVGLPSVVSSTSGVASAISAYHLGYVIQENDIPRLITTLRFMVKHPQKLSSSIKTRLYRAYNWDRQLDKLESIYKKLLATQS